MRRLDLYRSRSGGIGGSRRPGSAAGPGPARDRALEELCDRVGGSLVAGASPPVLEVRRRLPAGALHGDVRLADLFGFDPSLQRVLFPRAAQVHPRDLLFFDLETTGLSGGAGTHAFLAGFLRPAPGDQSGPDARGAGACRREAGHAGPCPAGGFELVQYFLPGFASERFFLELIDRLIGSAGALVSYNGRCFDTGIVRNRYVMCGMPALDEPEQFDLLYPCRRIWKGVLPDHTLGTVEREVLGVSRTRDVPGWMVPQVYTDFLAGRGSRERLADVFEHNRDDVLSLLALLVRQLGVVSGAAPANRCNPVQLSRMLVSSRRGDQARRILSAHRHTNEALRHLGLLHRRERDFTRALGCFRELAERACGISEYLFACTEAAKICEHRLGDLAGALDWTSRMRRRIQRAGAFGKAPADRDRVEHRFRRLSAKLERKAWREGA